MRSCLLAFCLVGLLSACGGTRLNTGEIDYRMVAVDSETSATNAIELKGKYFDTDAAEAMDVMAPNDTLAIRVLQAYVCDFSEASVREYLWIFERLSPAYTQCRRSNAIFNDSYQETRGEIAVVAEAFEQGDQRLEFQAGIEATEKGRLIYFGEDVRETGQFLNLTNIPLYGPTAYAGKPFVIRLSVVELDDTENKQLSSTIEQLAQLGQKAYPPGSDILGLLNGLGKAFLSGSQDDLEFDYLIVFDGHGGTTSSHAPLAVGTYVLVRKEDRNRPFPWDEVKLERQSGRLICVNKNEKIGCYEKDEEFRGETYFSLKVTKNEPALENEDFQKFSEFKVSASEQVQIGSVEALEELAGNFASEVATDRLFDVARSRLPVLQSKESSRFECEVAYRSVLEAMCSLSKDSSSMNRSRSEYLQQGLYDTAAKSKSSCGGKLQLDESRLATAATNTIANLCAGDKAASNDFSDLVDAFSSQRVAPDSE